MTTPSIATKRTPRNEEDAHDALHGLRAVRDLVGNSAESGNAGNARLGLVDADDFAILLGILTEKLENGLLGKAK